MGTYEKLRGQLEHYAEQNEHAYFELSQPNKIAKLCNDTLTAYYSS